MAFLDHKLPFRSFIVRGRKNISPGWLAAFRWISLPPKVKSDFGRYLKRRAVQSLSDSAIRTGMRECPPVIQGDEE